MVVGERRLPFRRRTDIFVWRTLLEGTLFYPGAAKRTVDSSALQTVVRRSAVTVTYVSIFRYFRYATVQGDVPHVSAYHSVAPVTLLKRALVVCTQTVRSLVSLEAVAGL